MASGSPSVRVVFLLLVILLCGTPVPAAAQTDSSTAPGGGVRWALLDAIGYSGLGFGLGLLAAWDMEGTSFGPPDEAVAVIAASTAAGLLTGAVIGRRAQNAIAQGRRPGGAHRAAALAGVAMAGGTLGALAAVPLINGEGEGTVLGSDEQTITVMMLGGTALGSLYMLRKRAAFPSNRIRVTPGIFGRGEYGLRVRVMHGRS